MLHLHFSNRLNYLTARLLRELAQRPRGVFDVDEVLVSGRAVERELQFSVAELHGVCANLTFDNLARWLWRMVGRVVPEMEGHSPFQPDTLTWQVLAVLGDEHFLGTHPKLHRYLQVSDEVMRYDLAVRIAGLFDQYITFRSDWLDRWTDGATDVPGLADGGGEDAAWQSDLWRSLLVRLGAEDRHPRQRFIEALQDPAKAALLPPVIHLYALPSIPPLYIEWLQALSPHLEIHLYVLNPCAEFWADIEPARRIARQARRGLRDGHDVGNPLLAAWAAPTRAYFEALVEAFGDRAEDDDAAFAPSESDTLLAQLQNRILRLEDLPAGSLTLQEQDRSLEVHVCHSLTRQLEVVVDRLLGLFAAVTDPDTRLRPADILVAVPDLETAAPVIDAVFSALPESRRIPYTITGRPRRQSDSAARALCDLLAFAASRLDADDCLALLAQPLIARRFGLGAEHLESLRRWIHASGYRFGLDAAHRERLGLTAESRNTLNDGLDRLFLAYALPDSQVEPVLSGLLPAAGVVDPATEDLAALDAFATALNEIVVGTAEPLTASAWNDLLERIIAGFMTPLRSGNELEELEKTRSTVRALCEAMQRADAGALHDLSVLRTALEAALEESARDGLPSGAVTIASFASLRGLPYRVVCLLGLDDGVFPRVDRPADFDLMARAPRKGDRQRRTDDRNVFLDYLLAARDVLHLSYTGFSDRTNAALPSSAVISELLDVVLPATLAAGVTGEDPAAALNARRAQLVVAHPLQPFAPDYFLGSDPRLYSFNTELAAALRRQFEAAPKPSDPADPHAVLEEIEADIELDDDKVASARPPFFVADLPSAPMPAQLAVSDLQRFFRGPAAYLLERQLQLTLSHTDEELPIIESLLPDRARDSALESRLYALARSGADADRLMRFVMASPEAPPGVLGRTVASQWVDAAVAFAAAVDRHQHEPLLPAHEVALPVTIGGAPCVLSGEWGDLRSGGLVRVDFRHFSAAHLIGAWIEHVVLCCAPPSGMTLATKQLFRDELVTLSAPADPQAVLADLLEAYAEGQHHPLPFYPKSSFTLVDEEKGLTEARKAFNGSDYSTAVAESSYAAVKLSMRGVPDPVGQAFQDLSRRLLGPLKTALQRGPL